MRATYKDLYLARFEYRTGEEEYSGENFVHADTEEAARVIALEEVKHMYDEDDEYGEKTELLDGHNPKGWYVAPMGYPMARLVSVVKVNSLQDIVQQISSLN